MKSLYITLLLFISQSKAIGQNNHVRLKDTERMKLEIGDTIPLFTLKDQQKADFSIETVLKKKNLIIYFYPKDETKVCTAQACSFRDSYQDFQDLDCEIIGISSDNEDSHQRFAENHQLPFILLSDSQGKVRKLFGVPKDFLGLVPGRYTYVINKEGEIIYIFNSAFNAEKHVTNAKHALEENLGK